MAATIGLSGGSFRGLLLDNEANADRQGSGFTPLCHLNYPDHNLYRDDAVGLNFEHIMNGAAADAARSMFTPRKDRCLLLSHAPGEASVRHLGRRLLLGDRERDALLPRAGLRRYGVHRLA